MKIRALRQNLEYLLPEIECYLTNLQQRRLQVIAHLLPGLPLQITRPTTYRLAPAPILLPRKLRPFIVVSSTYRIN